MRQDVASPAGFPMWTTGRPPAPRLRQSLRHHRRGRSGALAPPHLPHRPRYRHPARSSARLLRHLVLHPAASRDSPPRHRSAGRPHRGQTDGVGTCPVRRSTHPCGNTSLDCPLTRERSTVSGSESDRLARCGCLTWVVILTRDTGSLRRTAFSGGRSW